MLGSEAMGAGNGPDPQTCHCGDVLKFLTCFSNQPPTPIPLPR